MKPFWRKREGGWDRRFHPLWIVMPALPAMLIALLLAVPANHFAHDRATASENATIAQAQALAGARERWQIVRYGCYELCADATRVEPA